MRVNRFLFFFVFYLMNCQSDSSVLLYLRILEANRESSSPNSIIVKVRIDDPNFWRDESPQTSGLDFDVVFGNNKVAVFVDSFDFSQKIIIFYGMTSKFVFYEQPQLDSISKEIEAYATFNITGSEGVKKIN